MSALEPPVPAYQSADEFAALWHHVAARPHATVVEIGSLYGGTLWSWLHLPHGEVVVSVDLITEWQQIRHDVKAARAGWHTWPNAADRLRVVQVDSKTQKAVDVAGVESIDFLFIDGDHTYDGVRADYERWSPLVRPGGTIAFHDTLPNDYAHQPGVVQFVTELKREHRLPSVEWFVPADQGVGITAFQVPEGGLQ